MKTFLQISLYTGFACLLFFVVGLMLALIIESGTLAVAACFSVPAAMILIFVTAEIADSKGIEI